MSCMSLRDGNPGFLKRLVERATNRQPLALASVNGAGGSISGLENIVENHRNLHSSSSTSSLSSPNASTARFDDASQCTIIAGGEPRRKSTIQSYLANNPTSSSSESTNHEPIETNTIYDEKPCPRKRSCSVPDAHYRHYQRFLRQNSHLPVLSANDEDSEENLPKEEEQIRVKRRRKNAVAASTVHRPEELDALVQLHSNPQEVTFSRRQRMQQAWEEKFGSKLRDRVLQNKENINGSAIRKRSMSYGDGLNKLASDENADDNKIVFDPSLNLINDGIPLTAARRLFNQKYNVRSALSLQNAVEKRFERNRSPGAKFNRLWKRLKNIDDSDDEDVKMENGDLESGNLKILSASANASPKRQPTTLNGLQHLSNSVSNSSAKAQKAVNGFLNRRPPSLKINGSSKQEDQGLLAFSEGNLHETSAV